MIRRQRSLAFAALLATACNTYNTYITPPPPEDGGGGSGGSGSGSGGEDPTLDGAPKPNMQPSEQTVDLFGVDGNRFWFATDPDEVAKMNEQQGGGPFPNGDIYQPGGSGESNATYANHLFVTTSGNEPSTADYGQVEVRVIGQSTWRPWTADSIPNLRVDANEFDGGLVGGYEHFRFNNGLVGSIFRELIALEVYRGLGYPAPLASYAWVGSNVWGEDVQIPYTVTEVYKKDFCDARLDQLGGSCPNLFEFVGDIPFTDFNSQENCRLAACDGTRASELAQILQNTPAGPGFEAATADYLDWPSIQKFQCLSWMLWTGDDALHNQNNVVLLEREDGKFMYLPYSIDISAGQEWYQYTPLYGSNSVSNGCQSDPDCWAETIATCEATIADFNALDPVALVDSVYDRLTQAGMLRNGDEDRYQQIRDWYEKRTNDLLPELDQYRGVPCIDPNVKCGPEGTCTPAWDCHPACDVNEYQCGPLCAPLGQCFECFYPFNWCNDGSCRYDCGAPLPG
ncbi:MAG: CotH kinase family protein [Polyangiaceae bacterium]